MAETRTETSSASSTTHERDRLNRLLTVFSGGIGVQFGDEDVKKPVTHGRGPSSTSDSGDPLDGDRKVKINDPRGPPSSTPQLSQRVKTFYVESWPEVTVKTDSTIIPNVATKSARSRSMIGGTPISRDTAIELRNLTLGTTVHSFSMDWRKSSLLFYDISSQYPYGLQTTRCGAKALVLAVQGYLIKHLLFHKEYASSLSSKNALMPNEFERRKALCGAICEILWQAGEGKRCCVCLQQEEPLFDTDYRYRVDRITEKLNLYEFKKFQDLQIFVKRHLSHFEYENSNGCILILYSLILSRTVKKVYEDIDAKLGEDLKSTKLLTDQEDCSPALINLLLTGRAVKHLHNGNMLYDTSGRALPQPLRGARERSHVGFLFWDKGENSDERTEVGSMLKTPKFPIWLTQINGQFGLLFSTNPDLVSDWRVEHRFVLYYYTGLSAHRPTPLTIETLGVDDPPEQDSTPRPRLWRTTYTRFNRRHYVKTALGRRREEDKVPALEQCIMTKWYGCQINWNGVFPYI